LAHHFSYSVARVTKDAGRTVTDLGFAFRQLLLR
jgi:hypothetical protein